jgi:hypothetical protein
MSVECYETRGSLVLESNRHNLADTSYLSGAAVAYFYRLSGPYSGFLLEPGRVRLNDVGLTLNDRGEYRLTDTTVPLAIAPERNIWSISGSRDIAAFVDTAIIPAIRPRVLSPRPGDTISLSDWLTVRWQGVPDDTGSYSVRIVRAGSPDDRRSVTINALRDSTTIIHWLGDTGLEVGPVSVDLVRLSTHYTSISEGVRVASGVKLIERVPVFLVD